MKRFIILASSAHDGDDAPALGAACIAAAVRGKPALSERIQPLIISCLPGEGARELAARVLEAGPDIIGLSLYSWNRLRLMAAAEELKRARLGLPVIAGGPEAGGRGEALLEGGPVDALIEGEGEAAIIGVLESFLDRGRIAEGIIKAEVVDLAATPSPWLSGMCAAPPGGRVHWEMARGCPFSCAYCYEGRGRVGVRRIGRPRLETELELFKAAGLAEICVLDPTFNADKKACLDTLHWLARDGGGIRFGFEIRAEFVDDAMAEAFAGLPCWLQIGLQSADPRVMAALGRPFDPQAFKRGTRALERAGLVYGMDLIYGLPGDSLRGFKTSLDFALRLGPNHLDIFRLALLPGTELAARAGSLGIKAMADPPYHVISTPGFCEADIREAEGLALATDLFYTKGRAVAWFLPAMDALGMKASTFLERVARRMRAEGNPGHDADPLDILAFQEDCVEATARTEGKAACLGALKGLIRLHAAYGMALAEGRETELELEYGADELLRQAPLGLARFCASHQPAPRIVLVGPDGEGDARIEEAEPGPRKGRRG